MTGNGITADTLRERLGNVTAYANRAADVTIELGNGWNVSIRSLPTGPANYIDGLTDPAEQRWQMVRFGIVGWQGLKSKAGTEIPFASEKATIYGRQYDVVSRDLMDAIPMGLLEPFALAIVEQSFLSQTEQQAVDFTSPPAAEDASEAGQTRGLSLTENATPADGEA